MSFKSNKQPLVLEYKKRRFDGGTEREIIEQIERQNQLYHQHMSRVQVHLNDEPSHLDYHGYPVGTVDPELMGFDNPFDEPLVPIDVMETSLVKEVGPIEAKSHWTHRLFSVFMVPIMEIVMGLSGLAIGVMLSYFSLKTPPSDKTQFTAEQQALFSNSVTVFKNGLIGLVTSPFEAVRVTLSRS